MIKTICPVCKMKMNEKLIKKNYECTNCNSHLKLKKSFLIIWVFTIYVPLLIGIIFAEHAFPNYESNSPKFSTLILGGLFGVLSSMIMRFLIFNLYIFKLKKIRNL